MIGLIFGGTDFPKRILKKIKKNKIEYLIIDLTKKNNFKGDKYSYKVSIGQFGRIINILKEKKCKKVLFAGKVNKPNFSKIRLDFKGMYYIARIIKSSKIGDAAILKEIINIFKKEKIRTINSLFFTPELSLKSGTYTKTKPNKKDNKDIRKGIDILKKLNNYSFSQGAIVRNKRIIAVEGKEGTQKMLSKCKKSKYEKKGVLIKFPKKRQDLRIDLPTVGLRTLTQCKSAGLKGIVLKSRQNVFLEQKKCISFANKNKMFINVK
jgi:UDP-2,3-diacylglucosamine hydrolase